MPILSEYALTHCLFDASAYDSQEIGRIYLQNLKETLLNEAVVRDLRNGTWSSVIGSDDRSWHIMGKELFRKLKTQNRLIPFPSASPDEPTSDFEWCQEALSSHKLAPLTGIISSSNTAQKFNQEMLVAPVQKLPSSPWWQNRSPSIRIRRNKKEYAENLSLLFRSAKSIMFIDPHFDPSQSRYHDITSLLGELYDQTRKPLIEIHRCCFRGSGPRKELIDGQKWEEIFKGYFKKLIKNNEFKANVFIWDDLHDRHIISNLIGFLLGNGLDTTRADDKTTWTKLGRAERDDIQREFDPASRIHKLQNRFSLMNR